ncbi:MAG: dihydroneopterin aldolase [Cyanobacteria bacterium J06638_20]
MPDSLHITGIRAYGYTGLLPEEQVLGQWYTVDLRVWLDISAAAANDDIAQTYDYRAATKDIQSIIQTQRFKLIERLTEAIAQRVLESEIVEQVQVQLTKVSPPIPDFTGSVTVDITRHRDVVS